MENNIDLNSLKLQQVAVEITENQKQKKQRVNLMLVEQMKVFD
jgi:hypothetical protein